MTVFENQEREFKVKYTEDIKREVVAFLNTNDGVIFVGIDKNGETVGLDDADVVMQKISSSVRNSIRPDCGQFIKINSEEKDGKTIVRVNVVKGTHQPYYLGEKGLRPNGVFVRMGSTTVQAQEEQIRELLKQSEKEEYESKIAARQDLTFDYAEKVFAERSVKFENNQKKTLGLVTNDGFYTNLALLLSDQCSHSIKCAIFEGLGKTVFKDRKEFSGSLFKQIDDVLDYLNVNNKIRSVIGAKTRTDEKEYPETSIREAVLNALIHRDYSFGGSVLISLFDDRLEITSLGGLVNGISKEALFIGISETRNKKLADVFYRLRYIEAYGTGIPRIMESYRDMSIKPKINLFENTFQIVIPNRIYSAKTVNESLMEKYERLSKEYLIDHEYITKEKASELFGTTPARAYVILEGFVSEKKLAVSKMGKKKIYKL